MPHEKDCLGLCFFENLVFYAVNDPSRSSYLRHIGAVDFNFDIARTLVGRENPRLQNLRKYIAQLIDRYDTGRLRVLHQANYECWAILPKLVYDNADEREAYINILMNGHRRKEIYPVWHDVSKDHFKLLQLRTSKSMQGLQTIGEGLPDVDFASAFKIGQLWINHQHPGGSFLTIGAFGQCIAVSSFILGKLRGATIIKFDDPKDLPYLWLQKARDLPWMNGLHEQIQVYGQHAQQIIEILTSFWDDAATIIKMDTLDKMHVRADERTYGFDLSYAFPAIMLALSN